MRITIVLGPFLPAPPGPAGAVEKIWHGLAREFSAAGHEVTVIERAGVTRTVADGASGQPRYLPIPGFERPRAMPLTLWRDFRYSLSAIRAMPAADVTVTNTFFLPTVPFVALRRRLAPEAGVVVPSVARMPKGQLRLFAKVPVVLTVSEAAKSAILAELPASRRQNVVVVHNPIDTSVFRRVNVARRGEPLHVLFAGRIAPEKGVHVLVEAFRGASPRFGAASKLTVVGPHEVERGGGGGDYLARCRALAAGAEVVFRPSIDEPAELARLMQSADIFAYPSLAEKGETFGVSALEAMACGCLPVVSNLECFRDFIRHGANGLTFEFRNDAVENLVAALVQASCDAEGRERMREAAAAEAGRFSYPKIAADYVRVFEALRGSSGSQT